MYYKRVIKNKFWSNNYIEYKINNDRNRILSVEEYLDKISPYLRDINDLKQSDTWKIQLTMTINFFSSEDDNDEERVMHLKSDNIRIMVSDQDEGIAKRFDSFKNRYQNNIQSMRGVCLRLFSIAVI